MCVELFMNPWLCILRSCFIEYHAGGWNTNTIITCKVLSTDMIDKLTALTVEIIK